MQLLTKLASSGVVEIPYPRTVHLREPAGDSRAVRAAMRTASSSNPAMAEAIESTMVRFTALTTGGVMSDSWNSFTNLTILCVVSSIGPFPSNRLASFL